MAALVEDTYAIGPKAAAATRGHQDPLPLKPAHNSNIHVSPQILGAAKLEGDAVLEKLETAPTGLSQAAAEERARAIGPNEVAQEKPPSWPMRLFRIVLNPLVILPGALSAISFATGDKRAGTVMVMMVILSAGLRFLQEARADTAAARLRAMIHVTATVLRDGMPREEPLRQLL